VQVTEPEKLRVAAIGCGDVARHRYFPYLAGENPFIELVACADIDPGRSADLAGRFGLVSCTPDAALRDPEIDLILNLTPPLAHEETNAAALQQGKHVYSEKPFALTYSAGCELTRLADAAGRRLASAPDTILGPSLQLARSMIDEGRIGRPYMASMSFVTADRRWHPDPQFFYREGAGPIFDEGPYFLSALVALLGPVEEVVALSNTYRTELEIPSRERADMPFRPRVPTSYVGSLRLQSGVLVSMLMSFDVRGTTMPPLEIYGEAGTLRPAFPGFYNGPVLFGREHDRITQAVQPTWRTAVDEARGIGVEELARAIQMGTPSRLEGAFPLHVLEAMEAIVASASTGRHLRLSSTTERPRVYAPEENPRNV
jgi:predicted dehydrogenase